MRGRGAGNLDDGTAGLTVTAFGSSRAASEPPPDSGPGKRPGGSGNTYGASSATPACSPPKSRSWIPPDSSSSSLRGGHWKFTASGGVQPL